MTDFDAVFAPEAAEALDELFDWIAEQASDDVARRYVDALVSTCAELRQFPHRGTPRGDIRPGLRVTHHRGRTVIA